MKSLLLILGILMIIGAVVLGVWLCIWVMLYGGIMQTVNNWGIDTSKVIWGIIKACFFQVGAIPAYLLGLLGVILCRVALVK